MATGPGERVRVASVPGGADPAAFHKAMVSVQGFIWDPRPTISRYTFPEGDPLPSGSFELIPWIGWDSNEEFSS